MASSLFNRFGGGNMMQQSYQPAPQQHGQNNWLLNVLSQYTQIQNNPGKILDILLNNKKINQQQYDEMQSFRNNPAQIANYLTQHGKSGEINQASQLGSQLINNFKQQ